MDENYAALIIDVKRSTKYQIEYRQAVQELLSASTRLLNDMFSENIEKPMMFSGGDEIQGLFRDYATAFLYYRFMNMIVGSSTLRAGIGFGSWDITLLGEGSSAQDGAAYHRARRAIERAHENRKYDLCFSVNKHIDDTLMTLADHSLSICAMRTAAQNEIGMLFELLRPITLYGYTASYASKLSDFLVEYSVIKNRMGERTKLVDKTLGKKHGSALFTDASRPLPVGDYLSRLEGYSLEEKESAGFLRILSEASGMTRQGIGRLVAQGRILQERNSALFFTYVILRKLSDRECAQ